MFRKIAKASGVLMIMLLLFIVIPSSFALNETDTLSVDIADVSDDSLIGYEPSEYYFNSSNVKSGDGSIDNPYRDLTTDRIESYSTLHFANGDYSLDDGGSLTGVAFIGENPEKTVISYVGDANCGEFYIDKGDTLTLKNITFVGFNFITTGGSILAENCIFKNTIAPSQESSGTDLVGSAVNSYGGVIYATFGGSYGNYRDPTAYIDNCTFINNTAEYGGAIYFNYGELYITNSVFDDNYAYNFGGVIFTQHEVYVSIENTSFSNDRSINDAGGAIYLLNSYLLANNMSFVNCSSTFGGALASLNSKLEITDLTAVNNTAIYDGGAIYQMYNNISVTYSDFTGNSARNGGAMFVDDVGTFELAYNNFKLNNAELIGGAVYSLLAHSSTIKSNVYSRNNAALSNDLYETDDVNMVIGSGDYTLIYNDTYYNGLLPLKYNLADNNLVTPVKNQGDGGNCWAFGAIAALESAILKATGESIILSEENMKNIIELFSDYGWNTETNEGGNDEMALGYLTSWLGPVLESLDEYDDSSALSAVLDAYTHVQNVRYLSRNGYTDNEAIKRAIMSFGAVATGIYMDQENYFDEYRGSYYCPSASYANHEIVIVGWDDSYSKNNFVRTPSGNGAWICKNSWDTDWGNEGFFYVSYYDAIVAEVGNPVACYVFVFNDSERYERNYQYDIIGPNDYYEASGSTIWVQNIFEADNNEMLAAVSTYFRYETDYELYIYVNDQLALTRSGTCIPGYITINLGQYVTLSAGDKFTVRFKLTGDNAEFAVSHESQANKLFFTSGVSFVSKNGSSWTDLYTSESEVACIKAFTILDTIVSADPILKLDVTTNYNNAKINVKVVDKLTNQVLRYNGDVTINVAGSVYNAILVNGRTTVSHTFSDVGQYDIKATFGELSASTTVTISKLEAPLTPSVAVDENSVVISIETLNTLTTTVTVYVNDDGYTVNVRNGKGQLTINDLEPGNYLVFGSIDDGKYAGNFTTVFTIDEEEAELGTFNDLQDMIDGASSGSTITLYTDYYFDTILDDEELDSGLNLNKNIIINGNGHYIYGNGARAMWIYEGYTVSIYNLTFLNMYNDDLILGDESFEAYNNGGAIYNKGNLYLEDCSFAYNFAWKCGAAIYNTADAELTANNCMFMNNTIMGSSADEGGAIYNLGKLHVTDSIFAYNYADFGGAISSRNEAYAERCYFLENHAYTTGGAIFNYNYNRFYASDCEFYGNEAEYGGATHNVTALNCYFDDSNIASEAEGHNMRNGININCTSEDVHINNFYHTIISTGFSFTPSSLTYADGTNGKKFDVTVISNPNGEHIRGVDVVLTIDDNQNYIARSNQNGVVSFSLPTLSNGIHKFSVNFDYEGFYNGVTDYSVVVGKLDSYIRFNENQLTFDYGDSASATVTTSNCAVSRAYIADYTGARVIVTGNKVTVSGLNAGSYTLYVEGIPIGGQGYCQDFIPVTVNPVASSINFNGNQISFDYRATGSATATLDGCTISQAYILNNQGASVTVNGNVITITGLNVGSYTLHVDGIPINDNYLTCQIEVPVTVNPIASSIKFTDNKISFDYGISGSATATLEGCTISQANVVGYPGANVAVAGNKITVSGLDAGSYTLHVEGTSINNNYLSCQADIPLTVNKIASSISFDNNQITFDYGASASATATLDGCGISQAEVSGHPEANVVVSGNKITVSGLNAGSYTLKVTTAPDKNHMASEASLPIIVNKVASQVTVNGLTGNIAQPVTLTANVVNSNNVNVNEGSVSFYDGGSLIGNANVNNGVATLTYTPTAAGQHSISARFTSANYLNSEGSGILSVSKSSVNLAVENIATVYFNTPSSFVVSVNSNSRAVNEGQVKFYISNELIGTANVNNGKASLSYSTKTAGTFTLKVEYDETANYLSAQSSVNFKVDKLPTALTAESVTLDEQDAKTFAVTLKDQNSNPLSNQAVKLEARKGADTQTFTATTNGNGVASFDVAKLTGGVWTVTGTYDGDNNYVASTVTGNAITVRMSTTTAIEAISNAKVDTPYKFKAEIKDKNGNPVKEGSVTFYIDGVNIGKVDLSGSNQYLEYAPTSVGQHTLRAAFEGTAVYKTSDSTVSFSVAEKTVQPDVTIPSLNNPSADGSVEISFPSDATGQVTLSVNGNDRVFDVVNGKAKVVLPELPNGNYNYAIRYSGDSKYSPFAREGTFNVYHDYSSITASDVTVTYGSGAFYAVTVYDIEGNPAVGESVVVLVNGVVFNTITTNENGVASFEVTQKPGTYSISTMAMSKTKVTTLTVNHLLKLKSAKVKKSAKKLVLKASLGKVNGQYLSGKKIKFKFNGKKYKAKTNSKGVAKVTVKSNVLKKLKVGKKVKYQAQYGGDTVKKSVKVKK